MIINVLISTIDSGINKISKIIQDKISDVKYIVSYQYTDNKPAKIPKDLNKDDVIISQIPGRGLSRNRNNALRFATGDIGVIADDDVKYLSDSFNIIRKVFEENRDLDVACFKIKTPDGEPEYKKYPEERYLLNKGKRHSISSIEIAFRINRIKEKDISFDERFGLGNKIITSGEESVFIQDCIKERLKVEFFPLYIVEHLLDSTTRKILPYSKFWARISAGVDARVNPIWAIPKAFGRTVKQLPKIIRNGKNPFVFLFYGLHAIIYIYTTNRKNHYS